MSGESGVVVGLKILALFVVSTIAGSKTTKNGYGDPLICFPGSYNAPLIARNWLGLGVIYLGRRLADP